MALYRDALRTAPAMGPDPRRRAALMTAGYCHEDPRVVAERGTELVGWYIEQQRERARLVWRDYDPVHRAAGLPGLLRARPAPRQRAASGRADARRRCARKARSSASARRRTASGFSRLYEALGIEEVILLCAVGPAQHEEVLHTLRLFGEQVDPALPGQGKARRSGVISRRSPGASGRRGGAPAIFALVGACARGVRVGPQSCGRGVAPSQGGPEARCPNSPPRTSAI